MGLISRYRTMRMAQPLDGTLSVVSINSPDPSATSQNYRIDGVVSGPGFAATAVVHHGVLSLSKWPNSGDALPITFDASKPERLIVHWDRLRTGQEQAVAATQALAERMRASADPSAARAATTQPGFAPAAGSMAAGYPPVSLVRGSAQLGATTPDPAAFAALGALLESGGTNVVRLDPQDPGTAALREALLRAVGDATTPPGDVTVTVEPS